MRILARLYTTALLFSLLAACSDDNTSKETETPLRPVRYVTVSSVESGSVRIFSGLAKAGQESNLSFRVNGTIQSLPVEVGDNLKQGQLIAEIDPSQYQLEAQQASANLAQAEATLRNAQANFERVKGLYENNNVSRNDLDAAREAAESSNAQVRATRKALELARLNVSYTKLKVSEACDVADVLKEINENATAGETIVSVACGNRLEVELGIPESMIALIKRDMDASVNFSAIPDRAFPAKVTEVGVAPTTGATYPVTVELTGKPDGFRSGLAAQVSFEFETNDGTANIILPAIAVGEDTEGRHVFVVDATDKKGVGFIRRQAVTTGELTPGGLEITGGVNEGDKVVIAGVNVVKEGFKVLID